MPANEIFTPTIVLPSSQSNQPNQIASWSHFVGFLLLMAGTAALGFHAQHTASATAQGATGQLAGHSKAISIYFVAALMDWALLYYCWAGVHHRGGTLRTLSGGRWASWPAAARDILIVVPFWGIWEGTAYLVSRLLGPSSAKTVDSLLPGSVLEILLWTGVSITAGVCEELAFRGYVQQQIHALTKSLWLAVILQAMIFGIAHAYQGWKQVVVITVLGILYGGLAAWRKNLTANIIAHACTDVWEGWLKFVVWR